MKKKIIICFAIFIIIILGYYFNPLRVIVIHPCSDYCPPEVVKKSAVQVYQGIRTENFCKLIRGEPIYTYGWGQQFVGCAPK